MQLETSARAAQRCRHSINETISKHSVEILLSNVKLHSDSYLVNNTCSLTTRRQTDLLRSRQLLIALVATIEDS